ncbi:MAG: LacI family DNA-binding transcriptional regulator [Corynebacterium sp.]|nr:LacI family DNA-binding transcriptional regulator [Corynebacterium sp.]
MPTIKDIAAKAKVSVATVSRVLNNDETMSATQETRDKIFAIADELGYTKHKRNNQVTNRSLAIIQWFSEAEETDDLYYYSIRIGIERKAQELGYEIIRIFNNDPIDPIEKVDAVIAVGKYSSAQILHFSRLNPVIFFVDSDTLEQGFTCITTDFSHAVVEVLDHFIHKGHRHIGMITGSERTSDQTEELEDPRIQTFTYYLEQRGLFNANYVYTGVFSTQSGYELMKEALEEHGDDLPDAFFIASDALAVGALRALQEAGKNVPEDVSIISFNDTAIAKQVFPPLSSVSVFTEEMGARAVSEAHAYLEHAIPDVPYLIRLGTHLTLRKSSKN